MYKQKLGQQGEAFIEKYLIKEGYQVLKKNYRKKTGEIDLIVRSPENEIVFIEVKTRRSSKYGKPEEAVDSRKIEKIRKTAEHWILENKYSNQHWRIDIIALELGTEEKITHLKNVTL